MEMSHIRVEKVGELILITQSQDGDDVQILIHREQAPVLATWLKGEYCSYVDCFDTPPQDGL